MLGGVGGGWDNCKRLNALPKNLLQEFECDAGVQPPRPTPPPLPHAHRLLAGIFLEAARAGGQVISSLHSHAWLTSLPFTCLCAWGDWTGDFPKIQEPLFQGFSRFLLQGFL